MAIQASGAAALMQQMQQMGAEAGGKNASASNGSGDVSFGDALTQTLDRIDALKQTATAEGHAYELGKPGIGLNQVMVDMAKADVATNMGIQVRNRVVSAYREIMNMQV